MTGNASHRAALGLVLAGMLALCVAGGGWGLPAEYSWSNDDVTPKVALAVPHTWSSDWYKYPYLQPWIDRALYEPTIRRLRRAGLVDTPATDPDCFKMDPDCLEVDDRPAVVGSLMRRSRHLRALMAVGTALAAYALARRLRAGRAAAVAAAAVVAASQSVVFFAHVGNVDVPSAFWASWALVAWAGLLRGDRARDWLALGALGGAALATKESVVGLFVLPTLVVVARRGWRAWRATGTPGAALRGLAWPGPALAAAALLLVYGAALNVPGNPEGFRRHVAYWLSGPGIDPWNDRYAGPIALLAETGGRFVQAMGWPLALACACGAAVAARRATRGRPDALWLVLPLASYFLFTLLPVQYTYTRFVLPAVPVVAVWGGVALAAAWRRGPAKRALAALAMLHGLLVCVHLDLLLLRDARYAAEEWLAANVDAEGDVVRYVGSRTHLPRLEAVGLEGERVEEAELTADGLARAGSPDVVVISSRGVEDLGPPGLAFLAAANAGTTTYRVAFDHHTRTGLESLLLGARIETRVSPRVIVLVPEEAGG